MGFDRCLNIIAKMRRKDEHWRTVQTGEKHWDWDQKGALDDWIK